MLEHVASGTSGPGLNPDQYTVNGIVFLGKTLNTLTVPLFTQLVYKILVNLM